MVWGGHAWQGCMVGDVYSRGACMVGGMRGRRNDHYSGRYSSYWNAFLFLNDFSYQLNSCLHLRKHW